MQHAISVNLPEVAETLLRILLAFSLALPVGWYSSRRGSNVGLRTLPVVAMASCGYALIGKSAAGGDPESMARVIQGLVAGIGFIGGGAILKNGDGVRGLVTAASIWNTGAVGIGVAYEREEIAFALALVNFLALLLLTPVAERLRGGGEDGAA